MAITTLTGTQLVRGTAVVFPATAANDATLGTKFKPLGPDHKLLIKIENADSSHAQDAVIFAGEGPMAAGNLKIDLAASDIRFIVIESGRYMKNDGYIYMQGYDDGTTTGSADVKFAFIQLP